jgi:hypothetical protein
MFNIDKRLMFNVDETMRSTKSIQKAVTINFTHQAIRNEHITYFHVSVLFCFFPSAICSNVATQQMVIYEIYMKCTTGLLLSSYIQISYVGSVCLTSLISQQQNFILDKLKMFSQQPKFKSLFYESKRTASNHDQLKSSET